MNGLSDDSLADRLRTMPSPFDPQDVKGPYDTRELPVAEALVDSARHEIDEALRRHQTAPFSFPVIVLVGQTGGGKSFVLRDLVQRLHAPSLMRLVGKKNRSEDVLPRFLVPAQPLDVLNAPETDTNEAVASVLLEATRRALFNEHVPGFAEEDIPVRPIDRIAHLLVRKVYGELTGDGREITLPGAWGIPRAVPPELQNILDEEVLDTRLDAHKLHPARRAVRALSNLVARVLGRMDAGTPAFARSLILAGFGLVSSEAVWQRDRSAISPALETLESLVELTGFLGLPVTFVFDQFEDLQIHASAAGEGLRGLARAFYQRLNSLLNSLVGKDRPERVPLFVLAVVPEAEPTKMEHHIHERLPVLPSGSHAIYLDPDLTALRDYEKAEELALVYLDSFWEQVRDGVARPGEPLWPFGEEGLRAFHASCAQELATPRDWLARLRKAWHRLVLDRASGSFQERREAWSRELRVSPSGRSGDPLPAHVPPVDPMALPLDHPALRRVIERRRKAMRGRHEKGDDVEVMKCLVRLLDASERVLGVSFHAEFIDQDAALLFEGLQNTWTLASVSTKSNRFGHCARDWESLKTTYQNYRRRRDAKIIERLLFLRTKSESVPYQVPPQVSGIPVATHNLQKTDFHLMFGVAYLLRAWTPDPPIDAPRDPDLSRSAAAVRERIEDLRFLRPSK